jgi:DNA polymerase-1
MEDNGVRLDRKILDKLCEEFRGRIEKLIAEIHEMAGEEFNINSTQQLGRILFEKLEVHKEVGLKRVRKTKTGYSTNAAVLESIADHPMARLLLDYRRLQKLNSTYIEALPRLVNTETDCVHTSFNQAVTATGRLSSSDPNLQNIPIRTEDGSRIREAFVPRARGWKLLSADYSQIELRIMAHISGDEALVSAFRRGEDIHRGTAALIFGTPPEEITPEMRSQAKTINFGIIYGMGPHRLSRETGIPFGEAQAFIEAYFAAFPGVKDYIDRTLEQARDTGYVSTLIGRKRKVEEINAGNQMVRSNAENMAVNTPIQGTAADLIKKAMVDIHAAMQERGMRSLMILQVHDELVFDVPEKEMEAMTKLVRSGMEGAYDLDVPLVVDIGTGNDWRSAH